MSGIIRHEHGGARKCPFGPARTSRPARRYFHALKVSHRSDLPLIAQPRVTIHLEETQVALVHAGTGAGGESKTRAVLDSNRREIGATKETGRPSSTRASPRSLQQFSNYFSATSTRVGNDLVTVEKPSIPSPQ